MNILLSGGIYGGNEVEWVTQSLLPDGRESMVIDNHIYILVSPTQSIFYGLL